MSDCLTWAHCHERKAHPGKKNAPRSAFDRVPFAFWYLALTLSQGGLWVPLGPVGKLACPC